MELELLKRVNFWLALAQSATLVWMIYADLSTRSARTKEIIEKRPLLDGDQWAAMQPGDTALIMLKLDQLTKEQQKQMMGALVKMRKSALERGVDLIAIPGGDHKAVVVRGALFDQGSNTGQSTNDSASQRDAAGGQVAAHP